MKTKLLSILLVLVVYSPVLNAQVAYYDALKIKAVKGIVSKDDTIILPQNDTIFKVLKFYLKETNKVTKNGIIKAFKNNPFINVSNYDSIVDFLPPTIGGQAISLSSIGGLDVTNFADGVAKFMVKRAKEELYVSFFEQFKDYVDNKAPEFKVLFPYTVVLLNNFQSWEYANIINTLREAFIKDLQSLLIDFTKLKNNPDISTIKDIKVKTRITKLQDFLNQDQGLFFLASLEIGNGIITNAKFPCVFDSSYIKYFSIIKDDNSRNALSLLNILSLSVQSNEYGKNYISFEQLNDLFNDSNSKSIFLGLLYQQIKNAGIKINGADIANILIKAVNIQTYLNNILTKGKSLDNTINSLVEAKAKGNKNLTKEWAAIFYSTNELISVASNIQIIDPSLTFSPNLKKVLEMSQQSLTIFYDISIKNYNAATLGIIKMISDNISDFPSESKENYLKYLSFASNVVSANSSDDVEAAIEAVALPAGSYSIKQKTNWSLSINSYVGGFYSLNSSTSNLPTYGLTAPIGLNISTGLIKCNWLNKNLLCGGISVNLQVIDLGALVSYHMIKGDTASLPNDFKINLSNIFSPGVTLHYNIRKTPLSLAGGIQYIPTLYKYEQIKGVNELVSTNTWRYQFSILVDIPFFTIKTWRE